MANILEYGYPVSTALAKPGEVAGLRVALEEGGQAIILKYLKGDEVSQTETDFVTGARYFKAALDLAPDASFDESRYLFCRGRAELFAKRYDAAEQDLTTSIRIDPGRAYSYNALGIAYLEQIPTGRVGFDDAINIFQIAIRIAPYWAYPRHNLALTYAEAGRFDDAVRQYQLAWRLAPEFSYLPYNMGLLFHQMDDLGNAKQAYASALSIAERNCSAQSLALCPAAARVHTALGALAETNDKESMAEREYTLALRADPSQMDARHDLAVLWSRAPKTVPAAERAWRDILHDSPDYVPSLVAYSNLLRRLNRLSEALPLYEDVVRLRPQYVPAIVELAGLRTRVGRAGAALKLLDDKQSSASANPGYWLERARADIALGDRVSSQRDYAEGLRLTSIRSEQHAIRKEMAGVAR